MRNETVTTSLRTQGLLPLYFHENAATSLEMLDAIYSGGSRIVEYTNRGNNALNNLEKLAERSKTTHTNLLLGFGTVMDKKSAINAIAAGADFIVSPGWSDEVFDVCQKKNIPFIPGCMTPTDIMRAANHGISLVKLFPGNLLGPDFVRAMRQVFPSVEMLVTGGVDPLRKELQKWFMSGVCAVGMGSRLVSMNKSSPDPYNDITENIKHVLSIIEEMNKVA